MNSAGDSLQVVANLSDVILARLEKTIPLQSQLVGVEDKITLEEMQTSLTSVLLVRSNPHLSTYCVSNTSTGNHPSARGRDKASS